MAGRFVKIALGAVILCVAATLTLAATGYLPGAQWFALGQGAVQLASGGAVAGGHGTVQDALANPAALALNEQTLLGLSHGAIGSDEIWSGLGLSFATSRGVLTFNALLGKSGGDTEFGSGTAFDLRTSFAKDITPNFLFGFGLNLGYAVRTPDDVPGFAAALDLGIIVLENGTATERREAALEEGFGLFDLAFALSFNNLGQNISWYAWRQFPDAQLRTGFSFAFFKSHALRLESVNDLTVPFADFRVRWQSGLALGLFDRIYLRGGAILGTSGTGPFTVGASIDLRDIFGDTGFEIGWAYVPFDFNGRDEAGHFFTLNLVLGGLDREGPETVLKSRTTHFSPNNDGIQDSAILDIAIADNRELKGWQLVISDSSNRTVRSLASHGEATAKLDFETFFRRIFATRQSVSVPDKWEWNGSDEQGRIVPDGEYKYRATAWDAKGNRGESTPGTLVVRTAGPKAELKITLTLFSPNGDGNKDFTVIEQTVTGKDTRWTGFIADNRGNAVRKFAWGDNPPGKFPWDGKDEKGQLVPDGDYEYRLDGIDLAGNRVIRKLTNITVSTRTRPIEVAASSGIFSPNADGRFDSVAFRPVIQERDRLESWNLVIATTNGLVLRGFGGERDIPETIQWDGRDRNGSVVADGTYLYTLTARYGDGDAPKTFPRKIVVDTKGPRIAIRTEPKLFSPDDDGENDQLRIVADIDDPAGVSDWQIVIRNKDGAFKTFGGKDPKVRAFTVLWDGKADNGETVESATSYTLQGSAMDNVGNPATSASSEIEVDILIVKTSRGLKILITNIEFSFDKWDLVRPDSPILNRVAEVLKKYADYKVIIEGHSDGLGDVDYNLMLSTKRARTVLRYLIKRGIDENRVLAKGLGMSVPVASNATEAGRAKNRRVEFILVKDE